MKKSFALNALRVLLGLSVAACANTPKSDPATAFCAALDSHLQKCVEQYQSTASNMSQHDECFNTVKTLEPETQAVVNTFATGSSSGEQFQQLSRSAEGEMRMLYVFWFANKQNPGSAPVTSRARDVLVGDCEELASWKH